MSIDSLAVVGGSSPTERLWRDEARGQILHTLMVYQTFEHEKRCAIEKALHCFLLGDHRDELSARLRSLYPDSASEEFNKTGQTGEGEPGAPVGHRQFELVRMYCDRLATAFHEMPHLYLRDENGERLPDDHPEVRQWQEDQKQIKPHTVLQTAEKWTYGMRQPFVSPMWKRGELRWHCYAPYQIKIGLDKECPSELKDAESVTVVVPQEPDDLTGAKPDLYVTWQRLERDGAVEWYVWYHDESGQRMENPIWADNINRYNLHPFAVWRIEQPADGEFWLPANDAWYQQQLNADTMLSDLSLHLRMQVHSQLTIKGGFDKKGLFEFGPDKVLHTDDQNTEFEYLTPNPNLEMLIEGFNFSLRTAAVAEGLPPDSWEPNSSTRNLAAKKLEREALAHRRRQNIPWFVDALKRTFEVHKAVANQGPGPRVRYSPGTTLGVELVPLPEVNDRAQDMQALQAEVALGLASKVDYLRHKYSIGRQEALDMMERIQADNARFITGDAPAITAGTQRPADVRRER